MTYPILYSFRRCPYAIRARLALRRADIHVELREIELKNKPPSMLTASPKGTVPVLITQEQQVIDESLDIMRWALSQNDPDNWLENSTSVQTTKLIEQIDQEFKPWLDKYKYADRHTEHDAKYYRDQCLPFLRQLNESLAANNFLMADKMTLADAAIFPFIRQFAAVDQTWFTNSPHRHLQAWLDKHLASELFKSVMHKYQPWRAESNNAIIF